MPQSNVVTFNVTLDLQHSDAASLDRQISRAVAEVGRQLWTVVLEKLKDVVEQERPDCAACGRRRTERESASTTPRWARLASSGSGCAASTAVRRPSHLANALGLAPRSTHSLGGAGALPAAGDRDVRRQGQPNGR